MANRTWGQMRAYTWAEAKTVTWATSDQLPYGAAQAFAAARNAAVSAGTFAARAEAAAGSASTAAGEYATRVTSLREALHALDAALDSAVATCG